MSFREITMQDVRELLRRYYPDVPVNGELGEHETLLSNKRAKRELGFGPVHTWMDSATR